MRTTGTGSLMHTPQHGPHSSKQNSAVSKANAARDEFVERIGVISQDEGLPRIAGRLFGLLLYEGRAFSFSDLAAKLGVSRGSISTSARMLADKGLIERVGRPGDRQDYYRLADDAFEGLLQGAAERAARARQSIEKALTTMPEGEAGSRDRVRRYAAFYAAVESGLRHAAERMED